VQRFRGGLVFKAHRLCVSLNSRLERHKEEEENDRAVERYHCRLLLLVAEVLVSLATGTAVYLSRRGGVLKVNKLTSTIRASDSSWHPGLPGRPLFPESRIVPNHRAVQRYHRRLFLFAVWTPLSVLRGPRTERGFL